jgi:hypothetical protein
MILGATDQKLWVFEVFKRSLGSRVGTNEKELTKCAQGGERGFEKIGCSYTKKGACAAVGHRPAVRGSGSVGDQPSPTSHPYTVNSFKKIIYFYWFF